GRVRPVDHINEKIGCALLEYGPGLKVIVPAENPLGPLERQIDARNLFYVSTIDELLVVLLESPVDNRGLESSREAVFLSLLPESRRELGQHLAAGVPANIYESPGSWSEPVPHMEEIFSVCEAWEARLDLHVAPTALALKTRETVQGGRTLVEVLLDG